MSMHLRAQNLEDQRYQDLLLTTKCGRLTPYL